MGTSITTEVAALYELTPAEIASLNEVSLHCVKGWDSGKMNKTEIARYITDHVENKYMAVLCGMATSAVMQIHTDRLNSSVKDLMKQLGVEK